MSLLRRIFQQGPGDAAAGDTATTRKVNAALAKRSDEEARFLGAFAYVLARVAHADLDFDVLEEAAIRKLVRGAAELDDDELEIVLAIAREQVEQRGGSENYLVTREFRSVSSRADRIKLLEALFAVAAADGVITSAETAEVIAIGEELGFTRPEVLSLRTAWREHVAELQTT